MTRRAAERAGDPFTPTRLEWLVAGLGLLLLLAMVGFLLFEAFGAPETPPDLKVEVAGLAAVDAGYLVEFDVTNGGELAAAAVRIEGRLAKPDGSVEVSRAELGYVPPGSVRSGGLLFREDPAGGRLELRAEGYEQP